jgi:hypothetical protein
MERDHGIHWLPLVLLLLLGWWTFRLVTGISTGCLLDLVNLAFHEFGHLAFTPFGSTAHYLGGSIFQLAVPGVLIGYFLWWRAEAVGAAFCFWWLGESLVNVSVYMADARELNIPLVGGGDHDWNELFFRFGLLGESSVARVSGATHALGTLIMVAGLLWWTYFVLPTELQLRVHRVMSDVNPLFGSLLPSPD